MKVAIDTSPLTDKAKAGHRVRGIGFYVENLLSSLRSQFPYTTYFPFSGLKEIPSDADLVHFTYFDPFFVSLPLIKRMKYVVTVHDMIPLLFPEDFPPGMKGSLKWRVQKHLLQKSDRVITVSNAARDDIARTTQIPKADISVVYNAASDIFAKSATSSKLAEIRNRYHLPESFVLYVGDATPNKNIPRLFRSLKNSSTTLVVAGKALSESNFDHASAWNKDLVIAETICEDAENIMRLGFVPEEDLPYIYQAATVFAMPSLYEGFGLPILEAMKSGVPVVTSRRGGIVEVAGDAAYYVDPQNEESIRNGIFEILNSKLLQSQLAEKGRRQAEGFSWKECAKLTQAVYENVYEK